MGSEWTYFCDEISAFVISGRSGFCLVEFGFAEDGKEGHGGGGLTFAFYGSPTTVLIPGHINEVTLSIAPRTPSTPPPHHHHHVYTIFSSLILGLICV